MPAFQQGWWADPANHPETDAQRRERERQERDTAYGGDPTGAELSYGGHASPEQRQAAARQSYGGSQQAFRDEAEGLRAGAQAARGREGFALNEGQWAAFGGVDAAGRSAQQDYLGMLRGQMDTSRQSVASNALLAGNQQGQALQGSLAGLARGGAGGALAARDGAAMGNALSGQTAYGQAQALRADEAAAAANQYGAAAAAMAAGDQSRQRQGAAWAEEQAKSRLTNAQQNAGRERSFEGLRGDVLGAQQKSAQQQSQDYRANEALRWAQAQGDTAAKQAAQAAIYGGIAAGAQVAGEAGADWLAGQAAEEEKKRNAIGGRDESSSTSDGKY
jgi:hypothetical protein